MRVLLLLLTAAAIAWSADDDPAMAAEHLAQWGIPWRPVYDLKTAKRIDEIPVIFRGRLLAVKGSMFAAAGEITGRAFSCRPGGQTSVIADPIHQVPDGSIVFIGANGMLHVLRFATTRPDMLLVTMLDVQQRLLFPSEPFLLSRF